MGVTVSAQKRHRFSANSGSKRHRFSADNFQKSRSSVDKFGLCFS